MKCVTMKRLFTFFITLIFSSSLFAQQWTVEQYEFQVFKDVEYGTAIDFLGGTEHLYMDVYLPICDGDQVNRKRPLAVVIHGGSFVDGSKDDHSVAELSKAFAMRGYVSINVNYRLGFATNQSKRVCNISDIYACIISGDEAEWHRSIYRGIQDVKGAIRYMINRHEEYDIDPDNIFLAGESAGGFIALGTGLLDIDGERHSDTYAIQSLPAPHDVASNCPNYKNKTFPTDSITRPDLGGINGDIETSGIDYTIKGIGNFFGGMMANLLEAHNPDKPKPVIYSFHQPCDLIVPIKSGRAFKGLSDCIALVNCSSINNTPIVYGSQQISIWNSEENYGYTIVDKFTGNNADCFQQVFNNVDCHAYDNRALRWQNMFDLFAPEISIDSICGTEEISRIGLASANKLTIYPNPVSDDYINLVVKESGICDLVIWNSLGQSVHTENNVSVSGNRVQAISVSNLSQGVYILQIKTLDGFIISKKFIRE